MNAKILTMTAVLVAAFVAVLPGAAAGGAGSCTADVETEASNWDASNWDASNWDASNWDASNWDASNWDAANWDASNWDASYSLIVAEGACDFCPPADASCGILEL